MEPTLQVHDILEREVDDIKPPSFPTPPAPSGPSTGFPAPKKRVSAFKQKRQAQSSANTISPSPAAPKRVPETPEEAERRIINQESDAMLASMSPEEREEMRQDLFRSLDPKLIQMLMSRANLDDAGPEPFDNPKFIRDAPQDPKPTEETKSTPPPPPRVTVEDVSEETTSAPNPAAAAQKPKQKKTVHFDEDAEAPAVPPPTLFEATAGPEKKTNKDQPPPDAMHFPPTPTVPDLDPNDPDFLERMHEKFFPSLPADPSKLAWMAPIPTPDSIADKESPYYPGQDSLPVSALRFDFRGELIPPKKSRTIPVTKGLHHHGEAPEAAGYTIPELARYARSAVAAQRCLAYQTLGRMLYRLGQGEWGIGAGGRHGEEDDLAFGLWRCFKEYRILESLEEEVAKPEGRGHRSAQAYATEALWLFERGGWKEKWRGL
ncbi:RPAP1-like protein [Podospora australis]|uniref:RPAP1-like protein n=1 Tax=Podospora australis TaxID=1536484 RepID=A0AAN7ANW1_9PEZI|nr:RPAP1-like protein [Podospora australis]